MAHVVEPVDDGPVLDERPRHVVVATDVLAVAVHEHGDELGSLLAVAPRAGVDRHLRALEGPVGGLGHVICSCCGIRWGQNARSGSWSAALVYCTPRLGHVATDGEAALRLEQRRGVHQVPAHDRGVLVRELAVVADAFVAALDLVAVARTRADLAEPAAVGLRRDHVADVRHRVEDLRRAGLHAVLVAGDHAAGRLAVVEVLTPVVALAAVGVEPLDDEGGDARFRPQPDRGADHEDVGGHHLGVDRRPVVAVVADLGRVLDHAEADSMVEHVDQFDVDALGVHDPGDARQQPAGVRLRRVAHERAVEQHRRQTGERGHAATVPQCSATLDQPERWRCRANTPPQLHRCGLVQGTARSTRAAAPVTAACVRSRSIGRSTPADSFCPAR